MTYNYGYLLLMVYKTPTAFEHDQVKSSMGSHVRRFNKLNHQQRNFVLLALIPVNNC